VSTVRSHAKSIYGKLNVHGRWRPSSGQRNWVCYNQAHLTSPLAGWGFLSRSSVSPQSPTTIPPPGDDISPDTRLYYVQWIRRPRPESGESKDALDDQTAGRPTNSLSDHNTGRLDESWAAGSAHTITFCDDMTTLTGAVATICLRGILTRLWDLNLDLISVNRARTRSRWRTNDETRIHTSVG